MKYRSFAYAGLVACLLLLSAGIAMAETAKATTSNTVAVVGWGGNIRLTIALMDGQVLSDFFSGKISVRDAAATWAKNVWNIPTDVPADRYQAAVDAVTNLNRLLETAPDIQWSVRDLYTSAWDKLPGDPTVKAALRQEFYCLKHSASMMVLTFVDRPADETPVDAVTKTIDAFITDPLFAWMELSALYQTPADPTFFDDTALAKVIAMTDGMQILRNEALEISVIDTSGYTVESTETNCCSTVTRTCIPSGTYSCCCRMCSLYCCIGSTWCTSGV